ncbi:C-C motif chemokine 3-like [Tachysurus fulvidraco]|uniref:C-C motif chemokine 3-like n=1 Tax=Tachysurus fulvidraco TaxID=1234273 RepID=UPI001FEFB988|nr:C-C motif chemokine 3-like [Tachysurus fulvidraco]
MSSHSLLLVLLVLACLQSFTMAQNGNEPEEYHCCTSFLIQPIPVRVITAYAVTELQCTKPGVIFTLQDGRHVCADPSFKWVKIHMDRIEERLFNSLNKPTESSNP